ncbi:hypothetical protein [Dyella japonica]|uniref:Haem-binding uptake Tiki superfamily ChaN domain-containing protein n=1 Tax=Dyella japonica DSM 16301 TaxID=1440762 RepID=A0A0G9GZJ8_9GAMM|nr:hypothetical protein [Dyella japonica]KLD63015.1 hypothetical protein Y882_13545 [Dyella japonica DSM 16301]
MSRPRYAWLLAALWFGLSGLPLHARSPAQRACAPLQGFEVTRQAQVTVFGDMHGTVQSPAVFAQAACLFAQRLGGERGVIGLELPESFNAYFDEVGVQPVETVWARAGSDAFWDEFRDGRHSAAMWQLVHRLIALSARSGGSLRIVALARQPIDVDGAALLVDSMKSSGASRALVLIGNAHARMTRMPGQESEPFARHVANAGLSVISLNAQAGGGKAWWCAPGCAVHPFYASPEKGGVKIVLLPDGDRQPWHGYYYVPEMTLSHPVKTMALPEHVRLDMPGAPSV